ncbi:hypothetical protein BS47DRAFT_1360028 [Hydnum rufescens UP504]|uniref:Uncharacterized protein n=1 Tax=Hydnum rufescens UP504 TaxID=1448309 RepID=A0A9P6B317_9AGAM|nr:hypothetical protein BS47DRAFT_1360028 [Hydnum rufescens UP504]
MSSWMTHSTATKLAAGNKRTKTTTSRSSTSTTSKGAKAPSKPTNATSTRVNGSQQRGLNLTNELEGSSGDGVLLHIPSKASQKSGLSQEDNNSGSEHPPRHATNKFSTRPVVEVPHSRHAAAPVSSSSTRAQVPPVDPFSPTSPPSNSFKPPSSPLPGPSDPFDSMTEGTTVRGAEDRDLEEEENHGDASDVIHRGGWFSINQIKWAHVKCEEFFAELDTKAKEWNRSLESNAFQALYKKDHPNTDPSVSAQDYTVNMVQPAYAQLIESFGGEESPEWATEAAWLIAEHESAKVGATKLVAQSGGDIAQIMANQKDKWTHNMQWLATMDIHTMFLMVTGNAASPAAHAQNKCHLGSEEMAAWYNSNFTMSTQLANIYQFILSCHSWYAELNQFNEEQGKRKRDEDLSTMYKTRTAIKDTLIGLFSPFVKMTKFPWTNLAKVLVQNKLIISNFVPNDKFPNFSTSLSDLHTTDQYKTLYYALKESSPEKKIVITKVDNWPVGEAEDVALITDRHGEVILSLAAAQDYTAQHGAGETGGGEGSKGVKRSGMDVGLDDRRGNKTTVGKRKKAAVKSVALIWDESEDADSVDNLLSFGSQAASHDSSNSSSIPRSHSSLHNQQQLPNQPCPKPCFTSSLSVTTATLPVLNGLGHLENVNIDLGSGFLNQWTEEELDVVAGQIGYQGFGDSSSMNLNGQPTYSGEQPGY